MKKYVGMFVLLSVVQLSFCESETMFVIPKKKSTEKPSALKEEMVDSLKSLLTSTSDLIASIAHKQHLIIQTIEDIAQDQGECSQETVHRLKKRRDCYSRLQQEVQRLTKQLEEELSILKQHSQKGM